MVGGRGANIVIGYMHTCASLVILTPCDIQRRRSKKGKAEKKKRKKKKKKRGIIRARCETRLSRLVGEAKKEQERGRGMYHHFPFNLEMRTCKKRSTGCPPPQPHLPTGLRNKTEIKHFGK